MKKFTKVIALILSLTLLLCFPIGVSAAEPEDTGVDTAAKGSLTIYKVDLTSAEKDGAWDSSYVSTGVYDQNVNDTLNSYALKDVEFTYLRVADVVQLTGSAADGGDSDHVETLYGISKTAGADLLNALGLGNGANRYEKADGSDQLDDSKYYYQSDVLISALSTALKANATTVKNALEAYVTESGTAMPLTDTYGKTKAENLEKNCKTVRYGRRYDAGCGIYGDACLCCRRQCVRGHRGHMVCCSGSDQGHRQQCGVPGDRHDSGGSAVRQDCNSVYGL